MGRQKHRKATPARLKSTHGPTYYRLQHGDVITTDKTLQTDAGSRARYPLLIDAMAAGNLIDEQQYSDALKFHRLYCQAGRNKMPMGRYGAEPSGGSDRSDQAGRDCRDIERAITAQIGLNGVMLFVQVCGDNVLPQGEKQRWLNPLREALDVMGRG